MYFLKREVLSPKTLNLNALYTYILNVCVIEGINIFILFCLCDIDRLSRVFGRPNGACIPQRQTTELGM